MAVHPARLGSAWASGLRWEHSHFVGFVIMWLIFYDNYRNFLGVKNFRIFTVIGPGLGITIIFYGLVFPYVKDGTFSMVFYS